MEHQQKANYERDINVDNRKVVLAFFVFLAICGSFFVTGYVLGNRADAPPVNYADTSTAGNESNNRLNEVVDERVPPPSAVIVPPSAQTESAVSYAVVPGSVRPDPPETTAAVPVAAVSMAVKPEPVKTVSDVPAKVSAPPVSVDKPKQQAKETSGKTSKTTAEKTTPPAKQAIAGGIAYSVQVAAFRARREAEIAARELEAKGFEFRIELPLTAGDFYRLKVGSFAARAEAVEMANRLKKNGFDTMITENKGN